MDRNYRNRRVGDFLKELELTEGRATGFPKIHNAIEKNGSPKPEITTDAGRNFFLVVFKKHPLAQVGLDINKKDFKRIVSSPVSSLFQVMLLPKFYYCVQKKK